MTRSLYTLFLLLFILTLKAQVAPLSAQLAYVDDICDKGQAIVSVSGGKIPYTILWSTGESGTTVKDLVAGDYSVNIKDSTNRDTTITFKIVKYQCVVVANHFTPNGDNYNDTWQISNVYRYPKFEVYVFNKWGQQVHHQKEVYTPWDGEWNGIKVPDGTYYYVFYFDGSDKKKFLKGDVSILR